MSEQHDGAAAPIFIIYYPHAPMDARDAEAWRQRFGAAHLVPEWDGRRPLDPGDLAITKRVDFFVLNIPVDVHCYYALTARRLIRHTREPFTRNTSREAIALQAGDYHAPAVAMRQPPPVIPVPNRWGWALIGLWILLWLVVGLSSSEAQVSEAERCTYPQPPAWVFLAPDGRVYHTDYFQFDYKTRTVTWQWAECIHGDGFE